MWPVRLVLSLHPPRELRPAPPFPDECADRGVPTSAPPLTPTNPLTEGSQPPPSPSRCSGLGSRKPSLPPRSLALSPECRFPTMAAVHRPGPVLRLQAGWRSSEAASQTGTRQPGNTGWPELQAFYRKYVCMRVV